MNALDVTLVLVVAVVTALAAERRLAGLLVGVGGVLLLRPLLGLAALQPWLGLVAALVAGLALALGGRQLLPVRPGRATLARLAGGVGGGLLGLAIVATLVTSLPVQRNPVEPSLLYYPPRDLPAAVQRVVTESVLVSWGRSVLLFPLLDAQGGIAEEERPLLAALHAWIVVGEPWRPAPPRALP